jgi:hypothetical protein
MNRSSVRSSSQLRDELREAADVRGLSYDDLLREMLGIHKTLAEQENERLTQNQLGKATTSSGN